MASSKDYLEYILDQLSGLDDISYRAMMGEYIIYYRGKVVVVDVWATWCAPCKAEIPHLEELEKQMKGRDVVFISVSIDTDHAKWTQFVREKGLGGVQLFSNNKGVIVDDYQLDGVPRFMVFSKQGTTVSTNAPRPSTPELKAMIEKELAK